MLDYLRWRKPREKNAAAIAASASMGKVLGRCVPEGEHGVARCEISKATMAPMLARCRTANALNACIHDRWAITARDRR